MTPEQQRLADLVEPNNSEKNCVNQMAGILEEYASSDFADAFQNGPINGWFTLSEQYACFIDDFYDAVVSIMSERDLDTSTLHRFAEALRLRKSDFWEADDATTVSSDFWREIQTDALAALKVIRTLPEYSRDYCDAICGRKGGLEITPIP
jgi:hypothetical protein